MGNFSGLKTFSKIVALIEGQIRLEVDKNFLNLGSTLKNNTTFNLTLGEPLRSQEQGLGTTGPFSLGKVN